MQRFLTITVRLLDPRYHGAGEPLPSPARLFQALVAGAACGGVDQTSQEAFEWLETLPPPRVGMPALRKGQRVQLFVPDNDLDSVGGNPDRIGDIRSPKIVEPLLLEQGAAFVYVWELSDDAEAIDRARSICEIAGRLYQFGRGVDMAWAVGEILDTAEAESRLSTAHTIRRPASGGTGGMSLPCPAPGSFASLETRHVAAQRRFLWEGEGRGARQLFVQAPKARFKQVAYDSPPSRRVYELRSMASNAYNAPALTSVVELVTRIRDAALTRLFDALPHRRSEIERYLVGRRPDDTDGAQPEARVRIVPLPSIGQEHADRRLRRVTVDVPEACPLSSRDVHWAFDGLDVDLTPLGVGQVVLTVGDEDMLVHYGVSSDERAKDHRTWRTVTAAALPEAAQRRRIDPGRRAEEAKNGAERQEEERRAQEAVLQALRHAKCRWRPQSVRVQREPFEARGARAEPFAAGTRFAKERLWHVEITFADPTFTNEPVVLGDGRFLGLGLMAPLRESRAGAAGSVSPRESAVFAFRVVDGLTSGANPTDVTRALRRAVMARAQWVFGERRKLPPYFTGHREDGSPARSEDEPHLAFAFDPVTRRLFVVTPRALRSDASVGFEAHLERALREFHELRAGSAGLLTLERVVLDGRDDPLLAPSRTWESVTLYQVNRHAKSASASEAIAADIVAACREQTLPSVRVDVTRVVGVAGAGLCGMARLTFAVAVNGPILLGRSRHLGGGLFLRADRAP